MLSAPLLAGNDLQHAGPEILAILTNRDVIAIDEDPAGKQATKISESADQEIWAKDLADGSKAIALFNRAAESATVTLKWIDLGFARPPEEAKDLWRHKRVEFRAPDYSTSVPGHGVVLLRIAK